MTADSISDTGRRKILVESVLAEVLLAGYIPAGYTLIAFVLLDISELHLFFAGYISRLYVSWLNMSRKSRLIICSSRSRCKDKLAKNLGITEVLNLCWLGLSLLPLIPRWNLQCVGWRFKNAWKYIHKMEYIRLEEIVAEDMPVGYNLAAYVRDESGQNMSGPDVLSALDMLGTLRVRVSIVMTVIIDHVSDLSPLLLP